MLSSVILLLVLGVTWYSLFLCVPATAEVLVKDQTAGKVADLLTSLYGLVGELFMENAELRKLVNHYSEGKCLSVLRPASFPLYPSCSCGRILSVCAWLVVASVSLLFGYLLLGRCSPSCCVEVVAMASGSKPLGGMYSTWQCWCEIETFP